MTGSLAVSPREDAGTGTTNLLIVLESSRGLTEQRPWTPPPASHEPPCPGCSPQGPPVSRLVADARYAAGHPSKPSERRRHQDGHRHQPGHTCRTSAVGTGDRSGSSGRSICRSLPRYSSSTHAHARQPAGSQLRGPPAVAILARRSPTRQPTLIEPLARPLSRPRFDRPAYRDGEYGSLKT
jgi:hypothetical protein